MNIYKIKNITDTLDKRNVYYNTDVIIKYVNRMINKTTSLKPGNSLYITTDKLPLSIYQLKIDGLVVVTTNFELPTKKEVDKEEKKEVLSKKESKKNTPKKTNTKRDSIKKDEPKEFESDNTTIS